MAISTKKTRQLYSAFKFLFPEYFKENKRYSSELKIESDKQLFNGSGFDVIHIFELTDNNFEEINSIPIIYKNLLLDAEDELRTNLYSLTKEDRVDFINRVNVN